MRVTAILGLVRRLLTHEAAQRQPQDPLTEEALTEESLAVAAVRVSDKLRAHLSQRIGQEGFQTLLARALTLTKAQFPHLTAARVESDGSLAGLHGTAEASQKTANTIEEDDIVDGAIALIACFLGLLVTFIGADLTQRILSTLWPQLVWDDLAGWENETL